ncbi:MAG: hypothetical protein K6E82_10195 [Eubacterium sp.]|nr:hypothetical protein [Eubacterium sp.]
MSREVEVNNIHLTATTPEDIQISLGTITDHSVSISLAKNTGYLTASNGKATTPTNDFDWSNTADISHYYSFGELIPASSDTGASIFFTPDANGIGQTVKTDAKYYTAVSGTTVNGTYNATSHINTATSWTPSGAAGWNNTYDDGYYIDIPVWFRTSSTKGANLSVKAYVVDKNEITNFGKDSSGTATGKELYRAVRVAILTPAGAKAVASGGNLIPVADGNAPASGATDPYTGASVLDWYATSSTSGTTPAVAHGGAISAVSNTNVATYNASPTVYTAGTTVATVPAPTTGVYGTPTQIIVRVWLEGEDSDCYNETAGQDWSISLKFNNETANPTQSN